MRSGLFSVDFTILLLTGQNQEEDNGRSPMSCIKSIINQELPKLSKINNEQVKM